MARLYLAAPQQDEDELHHACARCLDLLLLPPATWTTFPAGGYGLTKAAAARLYRLGLKTGWPDILIVHDGLYGIELKDRDGKLSRTRIVRTRSGGARIIRGQTETHELLRAAGAEVAICRTVDALLRQVRAWGIPMRKAAT